MRNDIYTEAYAYRSTKDAYIGKVMIKDAGNGHLLAEKKTKQYKGEFPKNRDAAKKAALKLAQDIMGDWNSIK